MCVCLKEYYCNNIFFFLKFFRYLRGWFIFRWKRRLIVLFFSRFIVYVLGRWRCVINRRWGLVVCYCRIYRKIDLIWILVVIWSKNRWILLRRRLRNWWRGCRVWKYWCWRGLYWWCFRRKRKLRRIRRRRKWFCRWRRYWWRWRRRRRMRRRRCRWWRCRR